MSKNVQSNWGVSIFAAIGLGGPDVIALFQSFGPVLDGFVRLGQVSVAIATTFYVARKYQAIRIRRRKKKSE